MIFLAGYHTSPLRPGTPILALLFVFLSFFLVVLPDSMPTPPLTMCSSGFPLFLFDPRCPQSCFSFHRSHLALSICNLYLFWYRSGVNFLSSAASIPGFLPPIFFFLLSLPHRLPGFEVLYATITPMAFLLVIRPSRTLPFLLPLSF